MFYRLISNVVAYAIAMAIMCASAFASQGSGCMPTVGTVSGLTFAQDVNAAIAALISSNSGSSSPATDCSASPIKGQLWLDTSVTPNILRIYDGSSTWLPVGAIDASNHAWASPLGGDSATIASATVTDLWSNPASLIKISGTTSVTQLASASASAGTMKLVIATGAFTLTYDTTKLILPTAGNINVAAGDSFTVVALTNTNVQVVNYTRADGTSLTNPAVPLGTVLYGDYGTVPAKTVYGFGQALSRASFPAYLAAVTRVQTGTLTAGNNTITSVADTSGLGLGMPIEATGIPANTTISSVTGSSIVMSANATANGSQTITAFKTGYGSGGSTSTVGVKDCRGRVLAGRDDLGGTAANRLTTAGFGTGATVNNASGSSLETVTMVAANLIQHLHAVFINDPGHVHAGVPSQAGLATTDVTGNHSVNGTTNTASATTGITVRDTTGGGGTANQTANAGSASPTAMRTVQPTSISDCVVVVLP